MNEHEAETKVRQFLEQHGFRLEQPSESERRSGKTTDFRVYRSDQFCFFCEVKSVRGDDLLGRRLGQAEPMQAVIVDRPDPTFNRLTKDVHTAAKQFDAVNPKREHPNVLAFVNYDDVCDFGDLLAIVTGNFYATDGGRDPIYRQYSEGRMKKDKRRIDLFLWMEGRQNNHQFFYSKERAEHFLRLCDWFGHDPAAIKPA